MGSSKKLHPPFPETVLLYVPSYEVSTLQYMYRLMFVRGKSFEFIPY